MEREAAAPSWSLEAVIRAQGPWRITLGDELHLEHAVDGARRITVDRSTFTHELELRDWSGVLVILNPQPIHLRLTEEDWRRLRAWLGPPGDAERKYMLRTWMGVAQLYTLVLALFALALGKPWVFWVLAVVGFVQGLVSRWRPTDWQLLAQTLTWFGVATGCFQSTFESRGWSMFMHVLLLLMLMNGASGTWRAWIRLD